MAGEGIIRHVIASSDWIVNIGTLILAAAAVASAIFAAITLKASDKVLEAATKQATASEQLAEVTSAIFVASSLPLLVDVPQHRVADGGNDHVRELVPIVTRGEDRVMLTIPTRNVGTGPAVIKNVKFDAIDGTGPGIRGNTAQKVVPSGETTLILTIDSAEHDPALTLATLTTRQFCAIVDYSDYSGERNRRTVLYIFPSDNRHIFIRGVDVHECDAAWNVVGSPVITNRD